MDQHFYIAGVAVPNGATVILDGQSYTVVSARTKPREGQLHLKELAQRLEAGAAVGLQATVELSTPAGPVTLAFSHSDLGTKGPAALDAALDVVRAEHGADASAALAAVQLRALHLKSPVGESASRARGRLARLREELPAGYCELLATQPGIAEHLERIDPSITPLELAPPVRPDDPAAVAYLRSLTRPLPGSGSLGSAETTGDSDADRPILPEDVWPSAPAFSSAEPVRGNDGDRPVLPEEGRSGAALGSAEPSPTPEDDGDRPILADDVWPTVSSAPAFASAEPARESDGDRPILPDEWPSGSTLASAEPARESEGDQPTLAEGVWLAAPAFASAEPVPEFALADLGITVDARGQVLDQADALYRAALAAPGFAVADPAVLERLTPAQALTVYHTASGDELVNLTPHAITVRTAGGIAEREYPSRGLARAAEQRETIGQLSLAVTAPDGTAAGEHAIPITRVRFGDPVGLPEPTPGRRYLVSRTTAEVALRAGYPAESLVLTGDQIRAADGRIIGCDGFATPPRPQESAAGADAPLPTRLVNRTSAPLQVYSKTGELLTTVPLEGAPLFVEEHRRTVGTVHGITQVELSYGDVVLPEPQPGVAYIVPLITAQAARRQGRTDVLVAGGMWRNDAGQVLGVTELSAL